MVNDHPRDGTQERLDWLSHWLKANAFFVATQMHFLIGDDITVCSRVKHESSSSDEERAAAKPSNSGHLPLLPNVSYKKTLRLTSEQLVSLPCLPWLCCKHMRFLQTPKAVWWLGCAPCHLSSQRACSPSTGCLLFPPQLQHYPAWDPNMTFPFVFFFCWPSLGGRQPGRANSSWGVNHG